MLYISPYSNIETYITFYALYYLHKKMILKWKHFLHTKKVMAREIVDLLVTDPDGVYIDCTLGGGGHSEAILERLVKLGESLIYITILKLA
jgi:hypothetical protein